MTPHGTWLQLMCQSSMRGHHSAHFVLQTIFDTIRELPIVESRYQNLKNLYDAFMTAWKVGACHCASSRARHSCRTGDWSGRFTRLRNADQVPTQHASSRSTTVSSRVQLALKQGCDSDRRHQLALTCVNFASVSSAGRVDQCRHGTWIEMERFLTFHAPLAPAQRFIVLNYARW